MLNNDKSYNLIRQGLEASSTRSKIIANNIANINTADYKKFDVIFEDSFNKNQTMKVKKSNERHISSDMVEGTIEVVRTENTSMREDGNNVDLDYEKVNQAANTLKYNAMITRISGKYNELKSVIK